MVGTRLRIGLALAMTAALCGCHTTPKPLGLRQSCSRSAHYDKPKNVAEAEQIAKRMAADVVGEPEVLAQEPFATGLDGDRWVSRGTGAAGRGPGILVVIDARTGCPVYVGRDQ